MYLCRLVGYFLNFQIRKKALLRLLTASSLPTAFSHGLPVVQSAGAALSAEVTRTAVSPSAIGSVLTCFTALATNLRPLDISLAGVNCHSAMQATNTGNEALPCHALVYSCDEMSRIGCACQVYCIG